MEIRLAKPFDRKQKHSYEKTLQNWLKLRELEEAERFESQPIRSSNQVSPLSPLNYLFYL